MKTKITKISYMFFHRRLSFEKDFKAHNCKVAITFEGDITNDYILKESEMEKICNKACLNFFDTKIDEDSIGFEPTFENIAIALFSYVRRETFLVSKVAIARNKDIIYTVSY